MPYIALKHLHVSFVALSGLLFLVRGIWMMRASPNLGQRWVKIVPHVVDTLLLASAVGLAVVSHQYPGQMPWLTAKLVGLVAYIVLGTIALKGGRTKEVRSAALIGALASFAYIVAVAVTKNPLVVF
ncbi:SirB2 family protein [Massilia sp. BSC265]|uniref:SirB2 family protein n=1 Tax=Massilia sp. BSC265 TaxID=1549812 RepID=UPI0004E93079|nr:SirB2 family protein [Massilia sp. BSC265]KFI07285.1 Invasion gene expression up-regulator SirB [Massilia sp. BSC265]